ncbi:MAG: CRTAC1 family protein, partial [Bacteroidota bacterium]
FEKIDPLVDNREEAKQILWADYDNDGDPDLLVAGHWGINRLYENKGDLKMEEVTEAAGLPMEVHGAYGACWGDYNRDGWLDLLCNYRNYDSNNNRGGNRLFKNNADGTFSEVTEFAKTGNDNRLPFQSTFFDYNNDQWPDIHTANDKLTFNTLYENLGNGTFFDVSELTKANARMNSMCSNTADMNNDGWTDIYVTNTPVGSQLLLNQGAFTDPLEIVFDEVAEELGVTYKGGTGWAANFFDADNDGDLDLYVSGSGIDPIIKGVHFYENIDLQYFEVIKDGFEKDTTPSFTNAVADFNLDGRLDIMVQNNAPFDFNLWENNTVNDHHWIKLKLEGVLSNRDGIGTRIESYAQALYQQQYTHCGYGFLGQNSATKHIGLANHERVDSLVITWSSGHIDRLYNLGVNQILTIKEGMSTDGTIYTAPNVRIVNRPVITNVEDFEANLNWTISPNPADDWLFVQSEIPLVEVVVVDAVGRELLVRHSQSGTDFSIPIPTFSKGVYLIKVLNKRGFWQVQKWIKQ